MTQNYEHYRFDCCGGRGEFVVQEPRRVVYVAYAAVSMAPSAGKRAVGRGMGVPISSILFLVLQLGISVAQANVCGSSVSKYLVPDYVCFDAQGERVAYDKCDTTRGGRTLPLYKVDFSNACAQHDKCYGTAGASKSACDTTLYQELNSACRELPSDLGETAVYRCHETAIQFIDVVRGQATKRIGIWMMQQVPFTGNSGCDAFISAQSNVGKADAACTEKETQIDAAKGYEAYGGSWTGTIKMKGVFGMTHDLPMRVSLAPSGAKLEGRIDYPWSINECDSNVTSVGIRNGALILEQKAIKGDSDCVLGGVKLTIASDDNLTMTWEPDGKPLPGGTSIEQVIALAREKEKSAGAGSDRTSTNQATSTPPSNTGGNTVFPIDSTINTRPVPSDTTIKISSANGETLEVNNFLALPSAVSDPMNKGYYYLSGYDSINGSLEKNKSAFIIMYIDSTKYFNVVLMREPLRDARFHAEQYLMQQLDISEAQACSLSYTVSTPNFVSMQYSGADLRFSFCPGNIPL